jgi:TolA-binding protein
LTLGEASRLSLSKPSAEQAPQVALAHEQIRLDEGIVTVKVPHLTPGRSFAVKTPDAEITVHGTAFSVEAGRFVSADQPLHSGGSASDASVTTRVRVTEGVVSVASAGREVFVRAGMQWLSPHAEPTQRRAAEAPLLGTGGAAPSSTTFTPTASAHAPQKAPSSSLAEQTRLLESGASSARSGDQRAAIASFNELLRRYPASPVAHEARVQLFRSLTAAGDYTGAAREARRYLAAYPEGPAREEAKKLALEH